LKLRTQLAFFATVVHGVLGRGQTNDHILTILLPYLLKGMKSDVADFRAAAYMGLGQLIKNNQLENILLKKFLGILFEVCISILVYF